MKVTALLDVAPYNLVEVYRRFRGMYYPQLQNKKIAMFFLKDRRSTFLGKVGCLYQILRSRTTEHSSVYNSTE
jgi:hypothetical protein